MGTRRSGSAFSSALDLTSGGTIGGDLTVSGHLTMAAGKQIRADAGTVAAPGYSYSGDTDLGRYRSAANKESVSAGNVQAVEVDNAGLVSTLTVRAKRYATTPAFVKGIVTATSQFDPADGGYQRFDCNSSSFTCTGAPIILAGAYDGQEIILENVGASGAMTITDVATDADGGVITLSGSAAIGPTDVAMFTWNSTLALWVQTSLANN